MTALSTIPSTIKWPEGIDEQVFLSEYWQKKPLLIRQAFPAFETPFDASELAGLSLEEGTTPRLIIEEPKGHYSLEHGPFKEDRFSHLTANNWSLLVTDVEKHIPELGHYLTPFRFLPSWRIDDLMISYAPIGASVGAHVDEYDVFLLQASGHREWSIDSRQDAEHIWNTDSDLKLVGNFNPNDSWTLEPGDILYLPPHVAHHGIASKDECTTWSIGFRAPTIPDMVLRLSEILAENSPSFRFSDGPLTPALSGEIDQQAIQRFQSLWREALDASTNQFADLIGEFVTESGFADDPHSIGPEEDDVYDSSTPVRKASFARMAWHQTESASAKSSAPEDVVSLFVNGENFRCSMPFAKLLCSGDATQPGEFLNDSDKQLVETLWRNGSVVYTD